MEVLQAQCHRKDLRCSLSSRYIRHCICTTYQKLDDIDVLSVEMDTSNNSTLIESSTSYRLYYHVYAFDNDLRSFPSNICEFPKIVLIDLSFNKIKDIDLVPCITFLDTFILKHNLVEYLSNTTFLHLKFIRVIDLSRNRLKYIEPGFLINVNGSLFKFDVSYNYLTTLDITNILWTQIIYCKADFSHNSIHSITNVLNWKSQDNSTFSVHGVLDGSFNNFTYFSMFNENGLNLKHAGKLNNWAIFARGNHWICDCKVYPFAKSIELFVPVKPLSPTSVIHDIYISSNEDDELIRKWLLTSLVPCLEKTGYDVFLFFRDGTYGEPREQETIDVISKSRNFIILLSDDTQGNQQWNKREWKYAWNYYKWDFSRELIIINYDLLTYIDVVKQFFSGFFTLRKVIDFSNYNKNIEEDILALLK
ncbi:LGR4 [Mytilus coruscus]|uniref:LGR4 n=1 Tax=Mytilus coruscus TaxID=42192 RepID=A0A6J8AH62_MYTCO|nr:LGR4 [Mytilus coruscus]